MTRARAVLFDVDGTLVDSNYLHVDAWSRALSESELPTESWRIHRAIGLDSDLFIPHLHGEDVPEAMVERAKDLHTEYYKQFWPRLLDHLEETPLGEQSHP